MSQDWHQSYLAAKNSSSFFDLSQRDELTLTGRDQITFLQGFCTNDIKKLAAGQGCEAFIPNVKGKIVSHTFIFREADRLILDTVAGACETLLPHLDRYLITEDVQLTASHNQRLLHFLTGPSAPQQLTSLHPSLADLPNMHSRSCDVQGVPVYVRRIDWLNQPGFLVSAPVSSADVLTQLWKQNNIPFGASSAWEALRIDAMFPLFGQDFDPDNLAQEVDRTKQAISFHKGCYLGQEPIARIDALGHVNRLLKKIEFTTDVANAAELCGAQVYPETARDKPIGHITSITTIPDNSNACTRTIALTFLRREHSSPGTIVDIVLPHASWKAQVVNT